MIRTFLSALCLLLGAAIIYASDGEAPPGESDMAATGKRWCANVTDVDCELRIVTEGELAK